MQHERLIIRNGRVIDPGRGVDQVTDVLVTGGVVVEIGGQIATGPSDFEIDATDLIVAPGLIDAHVHLRDPGLTYKEDLESGARAALAGGFVRVCCMPNTDPPLDTPERISDIVARGKGTGIHIHPIGTITEGRALESVAPLETMAVAGAVGFSDDGESTQSLDAMRHALELSRVLNRPVMVHCEDPAMIRGGSMHRGGVSEAIGDPGIPAEAEESYIARDIELAAETGGWLHVLHVSTVRGAEMVRTAKREGLRVTAEVMPHHLVLTDEWVAGRRIYAGEAEGEALGRIDTNAKVNPPLRPASDALGLVEFIKDGTFDFIATDHAPHAKQDKPDDLSRAAFGMTGLDVAIPTLAKVVERGDLDWHDIVRLLTFAPARTLNLPGGTLAPGESADITLIDPAMVWTVSEETIASRSKNTPLLGMTVRGRAVTTIVRGKIRHDVRTQR